MILILFLLLLLLLLLLLFQFERNSLFYHDKEKDRYVIGIFFFNNELTLSGHLNLFSRGGCHLDNPHVLACN